jgi:hypothetical protein
VSSAAELRELTELADLITELAGLIRDLNGLIVGLMKAAAGDGGPAERTLVLPPELAELARAHQELKAEQQALSARLAAASGPAERAAVRGGLAALTERATRAVAIAAAAVAKQESWASGTPVDESTPIGGSAEGCPPGRQDGS